MSIPRMLRNNLTVFENQETYSISVMCLRRKFLGCQYTKIGSLGCFRFPRHTLVQNAPLSAVDRPTSSYEKFAFLDWSSWSLDYWSKLVISDLHGIKAKICIAVSQK